MHRLMMKICNFRAGSLAAIGLAKADAAERPNHGSAWERFKRLALQVIGLLWMTAALNPAAAQSEFPSRPVRLIVTFAGGSAADSVGRAVAEELTKQLGVPVVVENIAGAGGTIGTTAAARAQPDGHTLMIGTSLMTMAVHMNSPPAYDAIKDFIPIARVGEIPLVAVSSTAAPFNSWANLMTYSKANPGRLNYATSGKGSASHIYTEMLQRELGFQAQDVAYKDVGQAVMDTATHKVDFFIANLPPTQGLLNAGQLRAVAVGSLQRLAAFPEVPTFAEITGRRDLKLSLWYGLFAPAGTPPSVVAKLEKAVMKAADSAGVRARLAVAGGAGSVGPGTELMPLVRQDNQRFAELIKSLGLVTAR